MGKSMYNFGKQSKEKARQQKQLDKAARRIMVKKQKVDLKTGIPNIDSVLADTNQAEKSVDV